MATTHIEVIAANKGADVYGLFNGQLLKVIKETSCFFFVSSWNNRKIKVSKKTKKCCHWSDSKSSPIFNI